MVYRNKTIKKKPNEIHLTSFSNYLPDLPNTELFWFKNGTDFANLFYISTHHFRMIKFTEFWLM